MLFFSEGPEEQGVVAVTVSFHKSWPEGADHNWRMVFVLRVYGSEYIYLLIYFFSAKDFNSHF